MRKYTFRAIFALFVIIAVGAVGVQPSTVSDVHAEAPVTKLFIPIIVDEFDTLGFGAGNPKGVAYNTVTGEYAIVDAADDEVYIVDVDGNLQSQFDTLAFGAGFAQGIAFNSTTGNYAIVDSSTDTVYIVSATGVLQSSFSTSAFGSTSPTGIAFRPDIGQYVIVDNIADEVFRVSSTGALQAQFDTSTLCGAGATNPQDIAVNLFGFQGANYAISDSSVDSVFITGLAGDCRGTFNTSNFGAINGDGIAFNPDEDAYAIVDNSPNKLFLVDARGSLASQFDTAALGATSPRGITALSASNQLAIVDDIADSLITTSKTGAIISLCLTSTFGATSPQGIASLPGGEFAVPDAFDDVVYMVGGPPLCTLNDQFSTADFGSDAPTDVGFNFSTGDLLITDSIDDAVYITDKFGELSAQFSTAAVGSAVPKDVIHIPASGNFALLDSGRDEVRVVNSLGLLEMRVLTKAVGSLTPEGFAHDAATGEFFLVDSSTDEVYVLDLPRLLEPTLLSGTYDGFFTGTLPVTLDVVETGGGFFSGFATAGTLEIPILGLFDDTAGTLTMFALVPPALGPPFIFTGTVSADLSSITFDGPLLGLFSR